MSIRLVVGKVGRGVERSRIAHRFDKGFNTAVCGRRVLDGETVRIKTQADRDCAKCDRVY